MLIARAFTAQSTVSGGPPPPTTFEALTSGAGTSGLRNDFAGLVGFSFTVGAAPITVTHIGRWKVSGNVQTHNVSLYDAATFGTLISGSTGAVDMTAGADATYVYVALATPIVLTAGATYYIGSDEFGGGDLWYHEFPVTCTSDLTVNIAVYFSGGGWHGDNPVNSFVPPNFKYHL